MYLLKYESIWNPKILNNPIKSQTFSSLSNASNASEAGNPLPIGAAEAGASRCHDIRHAFRVSGFLEFSEFPWLEKWQTEMRSKYNPGAFASTSVPQKVICEQDLRYSRYSVDLPSSFGLWMKFSHFHDAQHWDESFQREVKVHSTFARSDNDTVLTFVFFVLGWWPVVFFGFCGTRVYFVVFWILGVWKWPVTRCQTFEAEVYLQIRLSGPPFRRGTEVLRLRRCRVWQVKHISTDSWMAFQFPNE